MNEYEERLASLLVAMRMRSYDEFFGGDERKALATLARHLDTMSRYIDCVYEHESLEARLAVEGGPDLRDALDEANGRRTAAHNAAMDSLKVVNRIFAGYGLDPFIVVEPSDTRSDIGEKIAAYVSIVFLDGEAPLSRTEAARRAHETGVGHARRHEMLDAWLDSRAERGVEEAAVSIAAAFAEEYRDVFEELAR